MRLKRLELYGYKSFASRTVFEFDEGVTAIVGPNGSGKSNIADAVRWVMGEQSYSNLRAKTTEDMIFAGTSHRSRLGMAEVTLVLDNSEGWLPVDYTEVAVGRRAYRSGENEYILNGNRVRYRDIVDILAGSGLVRSSYTVLGQGLVDVALSMRPEARRGLLEEAAGIAPHLRKREEALKRIQETERNLERVRDLVGELLPRARTLRRQADRAEEHLLLRQDLQELQRLWYGYQWQRHHRQLARIEERVRERAASLEALRVYTHSFRESEESINTRASTQAGLIEALNTEQATHRDAAERLHREQAVMHERLRLYEQQRQSAQAELRSLASRQGILQAEVERGEAELTRQGQALNTASQQVAVAREKLAALDGSRKEIERTAATEQNALARLTTTISSDSARLEQLVERRTELTSEQQEIESVLRDLDGRTEAISAGEREMVAQEQELERDAEEGKAQRKALETELGACREGLVSTQEEVSRARLALDRLVSRYETLSRTREEMTDLHPGVREVLSAEAGLKGLLGTVATLVSVPKHLEQAIEVALGSRLQNIVAERWEDAQAAIAHLKRSGAGWATFFPLDSIRTRPPIRVREQRGVIGVASGLVGFEERLRPIVELLLGSVVVVEDLSTARALLDRRLGASLFVTLDADTVQPSGAMSGGARRTRSRLLSQEREWRSLPEEIAATEAALARAEEAHTEQRQSLADVQLSLQSQEKALAEIQRQLERAQSAVARQRRELADLERERKWRASRQAQGTRELQALTPREQALKNGLADAQQRHLAHLERLRELHEKLASSDNEASRQQVADLETRLAVAQRTVHSQRTLLESHRSNYAQLAGQVRDKEAQCAAFEQEVEQLARSNEQLRASLSRVERERIELQQRLEPAQRLLAELEEQRGEVASQRSQSQDRLGEAEIEYSRLCLERDRLREAQIGLSRNIEEDLGPIDLPSSDSQQLRLDLGDDVIELPQVPSIPPNLEEDIRQLKARLRRLGDVNPNAPQEYEQLLDRQTFLQGQEADLRGAIAAMHEVVQELDSGIDRDFRATFRLVNHAFDENFGTLFGGGTAKLVLTDSENVADAGIEIIVQPPGKRSQSLALLSGGERALTAAALLFALLKANPVPFCFLDEVDAALDEANIHRFRDLLMHYASSTQFVVITHNRHTIEIASTIYGISVSEQGVSQCISLKLDDSAWAVSPTADATAE